MPFPPPNQQRQSTEGRGTSCWHCWQRSHAVTNPVFCFYCLFLAKQQCNNTKNNILNKTEHTAQGHRGGRQPMTPGIRTSKICSKLDVKLEVTAQDRMIFSGLCSHHCFDAVGSALGDGHLVCKMCFSNYPQNVFVWGTRTQNNSWLNSCMKKGHEKCNTDQNPTETKTGSSNRITLMSVDKIIMCWKNHSHWILHQWQNWQVGDRWSQECWPIWNSLLRQLVAFCISTSQRPW